MSSAILRAAAVLVLVLLAGAAALADQFRVRGGGWMTYVNDRYGMSIDYPANVFAPETPPENGDGRAFASADARIEIFATHNIDNDTPVTFRDKMSETDGYEDVTYSPSGDTWLVISGFRDDMIFYEKYMFRGGVIFAFGIDFPTERKPFYAPLVERMEDSFKPG
jgi:hypothetical protein